MPGSVAGSFTRGARQSGGVRYVFATFGIKNNTGAPQNNVTFVAVRTPDTMGETPFTGLFRASGTAVPADQGAMLASSLKPTGAVYLGTSGEILSTGADVLQAFTEAEVAGLSSAITGGGYAFPYGFVVRNPSTPNSRLLPVSTTADGLLTMAFVLPLQPTAAEDIFIFRFLGLAVADDRTAVTQSLQEYDAAGAAAFQARVGTLANASATLLPGGSLSGTWIQRTLCEPLRTAGTAAAPSAWLFNRQALTGTSPGVAALLPTSSAISASFAAPMAQLGPQNFIVTGQQTGRKFATGAYTGGGSNTISTPAGTFAPGEEVDVTFTGSVQCLQRPYVTRLRAGVTGTTNLAFTEKNTNTPTMSDARIAVGRIDGDAYADVVVADFAANVVRAFSYGPGGLSSVHSPVAVGSGPRSATTGQFDGNAYSDVVVANVNSNTISVLLNNTGTIVSATHYPVGTSPYQAAVGDVNGDGAQDIVVANNGSHNVSVLRGDGLGNFSAAASYSAGNGVFPVALALGDVDGDFDLDIVTANAQSNVEISVLLNNGSGAFTLMAGSPMSAVGGTSVTSVALGDINRDGRLDIVFAASGTGTVGVLLNQIPTTGGFSGAHYSVGASNPRMVALGDLDGDGDLDVATANHSNQSVTVLLNTMAAGSGHFAGALASAQAPLSAPDGPLTLALGDMNGNGLLDIVVAGRLNMNTLRVFRAD